MQNAWCVGHCAWHISWKDHLANGVRQIHRLQFCVGRLCITNELPESRGWQQKTHAMCNVPRNDPKVLLWTSAQLLVACTAGTLLKLTPICVLQVMQKQPNNNTCGWKQKPCMCYACADQNGSIATILRSLDIIQCYVLLKKDSFAFFNGYLIELAYST